jgi:hypothetical protein
MGVYWTRESIGVGGGLIWEATLGCRGGMLLMLDDSGLDSV